MTALAAALMAGTIDETAAAVSERLRAGVAVVRSRHGAGAGTLWDGGLVITNHHVVASDEAEVLFADGRARPARVVARDPSVDLAALETDVAGLTPLPRGDATRLQVGQLVLAVGNPLGETRAVTAGIISGIGAVHGPLRLDPAVQANLTLLPGNSGGPLADARGRVVGINSMVMGPGVAIAVPEETVARFLEERAPGAAVLGIAGQVVELPGERQQAGVLITEVQEAGAAAAAGLMVGDVLLALDGAPTRTGDDLLRALRSRGPGAGRQLAIWRAGQRRTLVVAPRARLAA